MIHNLNPINNTVAHHKNVQTKFNRLYNRVQSKFPKNIPTLKPVTQGRGVSYEPCLKPSEMKGKQNALTELLEKQNKAKDTVSEMRNNIRNSLETEKVRGEHAKEIGAYSGEALRNLLKQILQEGEEVLKGTYGEKPCEYSCAVFGSTARDDGGAYPDLDYAFLIEKETPENVKYFEMLSQYLGDRLYQLGESTPGSNYGIHPCYGGATPLFKNWGWRYQNQNEPEKVGILGKIKQKMGELLFGNEKEQQLQGQYAGPVPSRTRGTAVLIGEPRSIAQWAKPGNEKAVKRKAKEISPKQDQPVNVLQRQIANISDYIDIKSVDSNPKKEALVEQFLNCRAHYVQGKPSASKIKTTNRHKQSVEAHVRNHAHENFVKVTVPNSQAFSKTLPSEGLVDIKKGFWRFPQALIASLCEMHGIREMNTFKRIEALENKGIFTKTYAAKLHKLYQFLVSLRSKCQMHYKCELHKAFRSEAAKQRYIQQFEAKEGMPVEALIENTKNEIEQHHRTVEKIQEQAIKTDEVLNTRQLKILNKKRKELYEKLEECNHMQAYKKGLVLDTYERRMFDKFVIPMLHETQEHVDNYVEEGKWKAFA